MTNIAHPSRTRQQPPETLLRVRPVAAACSLLLLAMGAAEAQTAAPATETVVVTGIRRSIETSVAAKRNADSIVEVVSSEEIGKLPEQSVAESLARLPGVTGQRGASGRTDFISIRGMPPKYGGAVMNGREMVSSNDGRSVEFDQFPSELVSSLVVYKTPDVALVGQGLSGTVDIRTLKPLDLSGRQVTVSLRGETNSQSQSVAGGGSTVGKRFSASYVDQFADRTVGVLLGYAHLDTPAQTVSNRINEYVNPYNNNPNCTKAVPESWCPVPAVGLPLATNGKGPLDYAAFPQRFEIFAETKSNVRDGLMATLEFKPSKDLRSQLDLFYSKFESKTVSSGFQAELYNGIWSGNPAERPVFSNLTTQEVGGNTIVTGGTMSQIANGVINNTTRRTDETSAFGWNTSYRVNDKLSFTADLSFSRNKRNEAFYEAYAAPFANGAFSRGSFNFVTPGTDPDAQMKITPAGTTSLVDPNVMRVGDPFGFGSSAGPGWTGPVRKPHTDDEIKSLRLSEKYALDGVFSGVEFGVNYTERTKNLQKNQFDLFMKKDAGGTYINTVPSAYLRSPVNLGGYGVPPVLSIDAEALAKSGFFDTKQAYWLTTTSDSGVQEKIITGFAKADIDTEVGGIGVRGNVGAQFVSSSQNSNGWSWVGGTAQTNPINLRAVSGGKDYDDILPSLNLVFDLKNSLVARFGAARTLVRPEMNDMRAGFSSKLTAKTPVDPNNPTAIRAADWSGDAAGNPQLEPWRANSFDLSLEKYFGKRSVIAGAVYSKEGSVEHLFPRDAVRLHQCCARSAAGTDQECGECEHPGQWQGRVGARRGIAGCAGRQPAEPDARRIWHRGFGQQGSQLDTRRR
ncbi:MAG: TonB-dependent receptor [Burkholderiales bacterium]|nr:TonB-dependent receptor [Burkholderiales bacterium]